VGIKKTMIYSYYPGCTLKNKAKDLDKYARLSCEKLGITLEEIPEWQCCGAVYPMNEDEIAPRLPAIRALVSARDAGRPLVTLCSACHHVIKLVNEDMKNNAYIRERVNSYLGLEVPYNGETEVIHYLELLRDKVGFDTLKANVVNPLKGRKVAPYYGCMLLRPSKEMNFDNPENPKIMEDLVKALGADPVVYSMRNECCGGYTVLDDRGYAAKRADAVRESAADKGADSLITACPLCMYNLVHGGDKAKLPTYYITELIAEALGVSEAK